ncbi:hypothetical protein AUJ66_03385 [Candidatus Desantisbacteria bacterium CG1_02_38_46]|uniref:Multidrug ABC transporter substrate-binding protein n=3 Tax=unclassified Candidatus Desantisiibacteriota TaxID=3106372 RepID=A0A2H9PC97_9BACT|nr:MAG: hypothetical protein AUJ66_03385 [Candidatus Desantisbacteria bacterium CG1_02_38_46]PIU51806.1 MAG: hypothetical protein COS91_02510 [Candidatus Desantisbacteria bacterium CG07_land_8_20_14_0_80_39_15]PIZ16785.1 MAG: hypothetical protein COY51_02025 [Candidatus Desantisbacteria bacterium CG_4_10_14_0_8_um_filter_39_17]
MNIFVGFGSAIEALRANKVRTALTILGVLIGVGAIILLVSIGQGVKEEVSGEIKGLGSNLIFVMPGSGGKGAHRGPPGMFGNKITYNDILAIKARSNINLKVLPLMFTSLVVKHGNKSRQSMIYGTTEIYPEILNQKVEEGRFFNASQVNSQRKVCVIGKTVASDLFVSKNALGNRLSIGGQKFLIIGILESKGKTMGQDQDDLAIVPITTAQSFFGKTSIDRTAIQAPSEDRVEETKRIVKRILLRRLSEEDFEISDQKDILEMLQKITGILSVALGGIAGISLLVGGIGIMNIMLVTVTERTREIGIRKAVGAKEGDILVQFLIESVMLSASGGVAGIGLGYGGAFLLKRFLPTAITPWSIFLAFGFSVFVGVFFGVYPASKAAKLDPIEALRYE